jgi:hypothetical protein
MTCSSGFYSRARAPAIAAGRPVSYNPDSRCSEVRAQCGDVCTWLHHHMRLYCGHASSEQLERNGLLAAKKCT